MAHTMPKFTSLSFNPGVVFSVVKPRKHRQKMGKHCAFSNQQLVWTNTSSNLDSHHLPSADLWDCGVTSSGDVMANPACYSLKINPHQSASTLFHPFSLFWRQASTLHWTCRKPVAKLMSIAVLNFEQHCPAPRAAEKAPWAGSRPTLKGATEW